MFKTKKIKLAVACSALVSIMALSGCDNNTTTNSSPIIENPTTSVSGRVADSVTGEAIAGAVVMIEGLNISARTDADGNYTLRNVPPNQTGSGGGVLGVAAGYRITLDMKGVTSPVAMSDTTITNRYADMDVTGNNMVVQASDVNGAGGTSVGETGVNNVANFNVGKASATVSGVVYGMDGSTLVAGARVELWQGTGGFPGAYENVAVATSDATTGSFSFGSVEAGNTYRLNIIKDGMSYTSPVSPTITENLAFAVDTEERIVLAYIDGTGPSVIDQADTGMDKANDADATFSWVLNEAVDADPLGYRDSIAVGGQLHDDIVVTFTGAKVGGVAKTVAWNADFTILSVTVAAASLRATSNYAISMAAITEANLLDTAGNAIANAFVGITFSTNGGTDLSATAPVVTIVAPRGTLAHNEGTVELDWPAIAGADSYVIYRTATVGGVNMGTVMVGTSPTSSFSDDLNAGGDDFGNGGTTLVTADNEAVSYTYTVSAVNSNKDEGLLSAATTTAIADTQAPTVAGVACGVSIFEDSNGTLGDSLTITFSEPMNASLTETLANYTGVGAPKDITYNMAGNSVTMSYETLFCAATGTVVVNTAVTDVASVAIGANTTNF